LMNERYIDKVRVRKAILEIAHEVKDINQKLTHFLENYREDYYDSMKRFRE
jgi:hypothetical protein